MSVLLSDREAVRHVQHFRKQLWVRQGKDSFFDSTTLTPKELEDLESKTIREMWTDDKGERHVRRF